MNKEKVPIKTQYKPKAIIQRKNYDIDQQYIKIQLPTKLLNFNEYDLNKTSFYLLDKQNKIFLCRLLKKNGFMYKVNYGLHEIYTEAVLDLDLGKDKNYFLPLLVHHIKVVGKDPFIIKK